MTALTGWQNFYVIVGSSAGALIGLQFVVLTLIANRAISRTNVGQDGAAFSTPTIVHFGTVLLLSALMNAWNTVAGAASLWGCLGLCGMVYCVHIARRLQRQHIYHLVLEDWLFHAVLPTTAYATLAVAACAAVSYLRYALFGVAASALVLLFVGIHNAWDAVTYHVFNPGQPQREPGNLNRQ